MSKHLNDPSKAAAQRQQLLGACRKHVSIATAHYAEFMHAGVEARSLGTRVWDESGKEYLDCGGYGVFILGHCHPRIVEAVVEQVRTHPTATQLLLNRLEVEAAETLVRVAPPSLDQVYFALSGAEAVETALKLARLDDRRHIIAMENGYHGMTFGALSVTGHEAYRRPFQPLLPDVEFVPFGDAAGLRNALDRFPKACVILEPVQGEAGVIIPPIGYLREVEDACRAREAFLIFDEIQTGLGRLGTWWGVNREGVTPDVLLVGKALSGGIVPVSAVVGSVRAFRPLSRDPMIHTSTFSGAPIAMAAAKATIETIEEEDIVGRAAALGERLSRIVAAGVADACPILVREVRSAGLLIAIEWTSDFLAIDFLTEMLDRRVLVSHSMNAAKVTRLTPPALLTDEDLEMLEGAIKASCRALMER